MKETETEISNLKRLAKRTVDCFRCGSKPIIEVDKRLDKYIIRCPTCKDMHFSAIVLDAVGLRWHNANMWRTRALQIHDHNTKVRASGARQLPLSVEEANALSRNRK